MARARRQGSCRGKRYRLNLCPAYSSVAKSRETRFESGRAEGLSSTGTPIARCFKPASEHPLARAAQGYRVCGALSAPGLPHSSRKTLRLMRGPAFSSSRTSSDVKRLQTWRASPRRSGSETVKAALRVCTPSVCACSAKSAGSGGMSITMSSHRSGCAMLQKRLFARQSSYSAE